MKTFSKKDLISLIEEYLTCKISEDILSQRAFELITDDSISFENKYDLMIKEILHELSMYDMGEDSTLDIESIKLLKDTLCKNYDSEEMGFNVEIIFLRKNIRDLLKKHISNKINLNLFEKAIMKNKHLSRPAKKYILDLNRNRLKTLINSLK